MKSLLKIVLLISLIAYGCQQKNAQESNEPEESAKVAELRENVIAVHDEVMPLMSDIHRLKNDLATRLQDSSNLSVEQRAQFRTAIRKLDSANQGMRAWMREFSDVKTTGVPEEEAITNLNDEMKKIAKVKEDMLSSLALGKNLEGK